MNATSRRRPFAKAAALSLLLALAACDVGTGSDIGPRFAPLPNTSSRVVVLDDQGRGVTGARVTLADSAASTLTGRNGRGDLLTALRARELVRVQADDAAATAGDRLGGYAVSLACPGQDVPQVLFVPDLPDAASATIPTGTQTATTTIAAVGGSSLQVANGSSVGTADAATTVTLRLGELQRAHLPGELPTVASQALLFSRGVMVVPATATFAPAATLEVPDDLQPTGSVSLFRLDPDTGLWADTGLAVAPAGGRMVANGLVAGGLYAFATTVDAATVRGRVVATDAAPLPDVQVRVDQRTTTTDRDGRFAVDGVAAVLGDGSGRSAAIELFAGGSWLPVRRATTVALAPGDVDAGDLVLDTLRATNVRVQQIVRGRGDGLQPLRLSSQSGDVAVCLTSDEIGQGIVEDLPNGFFGFQTGRPLNRGELLYGQVVSLFEDARRWVDASQFLQRRAWLAPGRRSRAYVCDALGGGPIRDASVVVGRVPGQGLVAKTGDGGSVFIDRDADGRATASHRHVRDGRTIVHAFSIEDPFGDHLEMTLLRTLRTPVAAFDRHGLVAGSLTGVDGTREHALRATRRIDLQEWWSELVDGEQAAARLPTDVDPAATHGAFVVGVPTAGGHLAAIEFTSSGGVRTLQKVGLLQDVEPVEGERIARDLPLDLPAVATFDVVGALVGLAPEIVVGDLRADLALLQPSGRVVDVARDLALTSAVGDDLRVTLPALTGGLATSQWLALVRSSSSSGGVTSSHATLLTLPDTGAAPRLPAFPTLSSPAPGATVAASGFTVTYAVPAGTRYATIELRSENGGETLLWQVLLPPTTSTFAFVTLPVDVPTPLLAGRTYTLTLSAFFGDGLLATSAQPYIDLSTYPQSVGSAALGIRQVARRAITITAN